jgi:D-sedoheptulose 7-phosphate isomerase
VDIHVSEPHMGHIEDAHLVALHMVCYYFMEMEQPVGDGPG